MGEPNQAHRQSLATLLQTWISRTNKLRTLLAELRSLYSVFKANHLAKLSLFGFLLVSCVPQLVFV